MKKKIPIISLFILFALPIPIAILGSLLSLLWFVSSMLKVTSLIEIVYSFIALVVGSTYIITYFFALHKTWREKEITIKTFMPLGHCLIALLLLLLWKPTGNYISNSYEYFGFAKKDFDVVEELDTHGGFHGDGSYYLILDCSENKKEALELIKYWKKLPLSENLELIMFGGEREGITYGYNLSEEAKMPKVENGYYFFQDRSSESTNSEDDSELLNRYSFNFSIAVYDSDTDILYYFEFDT